MISITRSTPSPACLAHEKQKVNGDYKCGDVLQRLKQDFHNKCYVCEYKAPPDINVEHFSPHQGNLDKKFDWSNLFYVCGHCNNTKGIRYNTNEHNRILDCTNPEHDPLNWIKYEITQYFPRQDVTITALSPDQVVQNTVGLLQEIYTGTTLLKQMEADNIKAKLQEELLQFQELLLAYHETTNPEEQSLYQNQIQRHLANSSAFTAFKIWFLRDHPLDVI